MGDLTDSEIKRANICEDICKKTRKPCFIPFTRLFKSCGMVKVNPYNLEYCPFRLEHIILWHDDNV